MGSPEVLTVNPNRITEDILAQSYHIPIKFSGIVVTLNEIRHLRECLDSLAFCDEILVFDLGSTDGSPELAATIGATVMSHERVPVVEEIREEAVSYARNDWVVLLDPDEVLPHGVEKDLRLLIMQDPHLGMISLPWQFYFCGTPIRCTIWGTANSKGVIRHRRRNEFSPHIHRGIRVLDGFTTMHLAAGSDCAIKHYWVDSIRQMVGKHLRYIKREGEARYKLGERFHWSRLVREMKNALLQNLFDYHGLRGGAIGIFLSLFYTWYVGMSLLSLRSYEREVKASEN